MKIKIKLTIEQFGYLVKYVHSKLDHVKGLNFINLNLFFQNGYKKMIEYSYKPVYFDFRKEKIFQIEVNQYYTIRNFLESDFEANKLDSYTLALFITFNEQIKKLI